MKLTHTKLRELVVGDWFFYNGRMFEILNCIYQNGYIESYICARFEKVGYQKEEETHYLYGIYDVARVDLPDTIG